MTSRTSPATLLLAAGLLGDPDQALRAVDTYGIPWHVGLISVKVFGILLVVAALGYLVGGFGAVLVRDYSMKMGQFTFVGEVGVIFWLLIKLEGLPSS